MRGEEVVKFLDRLGRDCGFIQVFPVSHSPLEGAVFVYASLAIKSCTKTGGDESHFHVSLIVRDKVTKTVFINHAV